MSVARISPSAANTLLRACSDPQIVLSIYDIFGTEGCLLGCKERKEGQVKKRGNNPRGQTVATPDSFTILQIQQSESNGCGSCGMFNSILRLLFQDLGPKLETTCRYKIFLNHAITQVTGHDASPIEESYQLFYPVGESTARLIHSKIVNSMKLPACVTELCLFLNSSWTRQSHYSVLANGYRGAKGHTLDVQSRYQRPFRVDY